MRVLRLYVTLTDLGSVRIAGVADSESPENMGNSPDNPPSSTQARRGAYAEGMTDADHGSMHMRI
jgi:hypothetical protein